MHNKLFPARRNVSSVRTVAAFSFLLTLVACSQDAEFGSPQTASDTSVSDGETEPTQPAEVPSPTPLPTPAKTASADDTTGTEKQKPEQGEVKWTSLFNGKNLDGWKNTEFGGEGEITVEKEQLILDMGTPLSGVNYTGKIPKINYEVELDAMRVTGTDFFCGLTFPVKKDPCSLIIGGWGGGVMGLSSLNGMDASENETTNYMESLIRTLPTGRLPFALKSNCRSRSDSPHMRQEQRCAKFAFASCRRMKSPLPSRHQQN